VVESRSEPLVSHAINFVSSEQCEEYHASSGATDEPAPWLSRPSTCDETVQLPDGRFSRSCLSPPMTLHPGGVINEVRTLFYPYPYDRKVAISDRFFEFVEWDTYGIHHPPRVVPLAELYIHHLSGNLVFGQGSEGLGVNMEEFEVDRYKLLSGDELDWMIFHIIDLRQVPEWLACLECRCDRPDLNLSTAYLEEGGINCCFNCTTSPPWTQPQMRDYYLRYNSTWREIETTYDEVRFLTADISPAVGRALEYDVPATPSGLHSLTITLPFNQMFHHDFFAELYSGPEEASVLRCVGHQHIAAFGMWLTVNATGESLCESLPVYGSTPGIDKGMLVDLTREDYSPPRTLLKDTLVSLRVDYNSTEFHTGVMGMLFLFYAAGNAVQPYPDPSSILLLDPCVEAICSTQQLLECDDDCAVPSACEDTIEDNGMCKFGGMCSCDELIADPAYGGCGGVVPSDYGDTYIDDVCAVSCGVCDPNVPPPVVSQQEEIEHNAAVVCASPTEACESFLSNLLACAAGQSLPSLPQRGPRGLNEETWSWLAAEGEGLVRARSNFLAFEVPAVEQRSFEACAGAAAAGGLSMSC